MKRSQRITRIARLSNTEEQIAAQAYASAQREVATQEGQLRNLRAYQIEYLGRLGNGASLAGYEAQKLRVFVQRIDQAIASVEQKLHGAVRRCERERLRLVAHKRRVNALQEVASRARRVEIRQAENRLQIEIDDRWRMSPTE